MWRLTRLLGRALPRLLGPGFREVPRPTSSDGPQTTFTTPLLPRHSLDRPGSYGPRKNRDPKCGSWKDAFHWMSAHVSPNTLRDAISWGTLAVLALHLARQIHFHAPLVAGPQPAERCSWQSSLYRFLSSSWRHPHSSLRRHVLPRPDCPAPTYTGLREPRLGQEEPSAQPQCCPSDNSLSAGLLNLPEEEPSDLDFLHASGDFTSQAKATEACPPGEKNEQDKSKALPLEEAMTSIQQLFQLSVAITFNFLGTCFPSSRQEDEEMGRAWGGWNSVESGLARKWWYMSLVPALGRQRQVDLSDFEACLGVEGLSKRFLLS
ncbi:Dele1 [Phodopus roborovskii]|uniref:Dele1 protein n=1 Tax=Phodopus roborovskii TaxID=109678 RepID=A0AAV0A078_PHORO|nr:Dele1 [Phodopus roborovskii]